MFLLIIRYCGSFGISGVWGDRIGLIFSYAEFMENKWSPKLESPCTPNAEQLPLPAVESHSVLQLGKAAGFSHRGRAGSFCSYFQCDVRMMALLVVASVKRSSSPYSIPSAQWTCWSWGPKPWVVIPVPILSECQLFPRITASLSVSLSPL